MAAVKNLYNPFREGNAAEDEEDVNNNRQLPGKPPKKAGSLNFAIHQTDAVPRTPATGANGSIVASVITPTTSSTRTKDTDPESPDFDPFHIAMTTTSSISKNNNAPTSQNGTESSKAKLASITPKLAVQLSSHEEVVSKMKIKMNPDDFDATAEVTIEGTVYVSKFRYNKRPVFFVSHCYATVRYTFYRTVG